MIMVVGVRMGVGIDDGDGTSWNGFAKAGVFDLHLRYPYAIMSECVSHVICLHYVL